LPAPAMPPPRLRTNPLLVTGVLVRPATRADADQVTAAAKRGQGIGAALLARAVEEARAAKIRAVALDVAFSNEGAHRFYVREGFVSLPERRHPRARGLPAGRSIRMERRTSG
jgi:GNAT superfamily N-acetyltransferase